ncbi:SPOR domain-containing protein [Fluviicola taffensis]|uniref:Sporulation domain-containing protein n=1 Tax=Fluviicola taffensis (strain DSM 16823 / NCIMB 13979 / RW262) TaxID=755732 RepID=F2IAW4_FLUTR|nr:SPOR domain-containing protein [Fluviicola taffensis]AEA45288.1 Sporulation domain-containing protein [Fluviicola taffensis DSM 16823]
MNNYLLQLLKEVKTLIIPGLGALTVTNESSGEILFMPYLKFDDGTLAKHIASKENMDLNDATNLISKFVREVTAELDKGNSYDMYQFGRFIKIDGEIAFEAWSVNSAEQEKAPISKIETPSHKDEESLLPKESKIVSPIIETTKEEKVPLPKAEASIEKEEELKVKTVQTVVETSKKEEPETSETPKVDPVIPPVAEKPKESKIVAPIAETPKKEDPIIPIPLKTEEPKVPAGNPSSLNDKNTKQKETVKKEKVVKPAKEGKKRSVLSYILWGFLVLVLGSGIFVAVNFNTLKKDFPILADLAGENDNIAKGSSDVKTLEDETEENSDSEVESEPIPEDQVQVVEDQLPEEKVVEKPKKVVTPTKETSTPKVTPKPKPVVTVNKKPVKNTKSTPSSSGTFDSSKSFHVIAGSFGSETNANKLAGKLQSKGFGEASVTMNSGMYRVSVKGFATLNEATTEAANIQSSVPGAWVLKM